MTSRLTWLWVVASLALAACAPPADGRPGSARAAAAVVRTYYGLVERGRTAEAARLRVDGKPEDLAPLDTLQADVGTPEPIEVSVRGATVVTPVVVYGRLKSGAAYRRSGQVLLTRAVTLPGVPAPAPALRWRILRISLTS